MTRGRRAAAGLVLGLCAATGLVAAPTPEPAAAALAAPAAAAPADPVVDRRIRDPRVLEASGLAPSLRHPGVLWTHNDSGNAPRLFALGRDGAVAATLRVSGTANEDWEALATLRDRDGRPVLAVGDVGDNASARTSVEIAVVREPRTLADAVVRPVRRLSLRYPDGAQDAEALLADPRTGRLYVVTKGLISSGVYAVPRAVWPGRAGRPADRGTLEPVATYTLTATAITAPSD